MFVVFVADGPHFDRMFKMVLIFAIRVLFSHFLWRCLNRSTVHVTDTHNTLQCNVIQTMSLV